MAETYCEKPSYDTGWVTVNTYAKYRVINNIVNIVIDGMKFTTQPSNPYAIDFPSKYKPMADINYNPYTGQTITISKNDGKAYCWSMDTSHTYNMNVTYICR